VASASVPAVTTLHAIATYNFVPIAFQRFFL
jgi:hypothetical protein